MEIVRKKIKRIDLGNCSYDDIKVFYSDQCNKRTICLFYKKEKLITILSLEDFYQYCKDEFRFKQYLKLSANNRIGYDLHSAKEAFKVFCKLTYLIQVLYQEEGIFIRKNQVDDNEIAKRVFDKLKQKEINVFRINFPSGEDIVRKNRANIYCSVPLSSYEKMVENGDLEAPYYLDKITNIKKNEFHSIVSIHGKTLGQNEKKSIYIVGPCIAGGMVNFENEKLVQILKSKLDNLKLSYKVKAVAMLYDDNYDILKEDINKNDIVIILNKDLYENELDIKLYYNKYNGGGSIYILNIQFIQQ